LLRRWTAYSEEWQDEVGSVAYDSPDGLIFFDPIEPPAELGEPVHTFVTVFFHARDARGRVWAPKTLVKRLANRGVTVTDTFEPGDELPGGVECYPTARNGEVVYWLPSERSLVVGDVLLGDPELRLCPVGWVRPKTLDDLKESLRPLLDLPVERIDLSHGTPVLSDGQAALAAVLA
jgi:glyoxylase-like metal-dependent hydrolase (beta-lactamase superfamily II)